MTLGLAYVASHSDMIMRLSDYPGVLKNVPGVYILTFKGGKCYVGQSINLKRRIQDHRYPGRNGKQVVHNAILKYGAESCQVIVEECPIELLDEREKFWIRDLGSRINNFGYNIEDGGRGIGRITQEMKDNMSRNHADVSGEKNPYWGKKHSEEIKSRMRVKKPSIGGWNTRLKGKPVVKIDGHGEIVSEYQSASFAAKDAGITRVSMAKRCNGKLGSFIMGYRWLWKDDVIWAK